MSAYFSCTCHIYNSKILALAVLEFHSCQRVTDRRTDGQTDGRTGPNQYAPLNFSEVGSIIIIKKNGQKYISTDSFKHY